MNVAHTLFSQRSYMNCASSMIERDLSFPFCYEDKIVQNIRKSKITMSIKKLKLLIIILSITEVLFISISKNNVQIYSNKIVVLITICS
jgi:hypothetical protein